MSVIGHNDDDARIAAGRQQGPGQADLMSVQYQASDVFQGQGYFALVLVDDQLTVRIT